MLVAVNLRRELAAEPGCPGLANVDTPSLFVEGTRDVMTQHLGAENAMSSPDHLVGHTFAGSRRMPMPGPAGPPTRRTFSSGVSSAARLTNRTASVTDPCSPGRSWVVCARAIDDHGRGVGEETEHLLHVALVQTAGLERRFHVAKPRIPLPDSDGEPKVAHP